MKYLFKLSVFVSACLMPLGVFGHDIVLPNVTIPQLEESNTVDLSGLVFDENGSALGGGEKVNTPGNSEALLTLLGSVIPASASEKQLVQGNKVGVAVSDLITPMSAPPQYNFTDCYPFILGNANTFSLNSAQLTCSNTYSATPIKLDSVILGQSVGTDYNLLVYFYNHDTSSLELKGGSTNTGNTDEMFSTVMPAGNYILYAVPQSGVAPIEYAVGALGWSNYDAYEANENPSQATGANGANGNFVVTGNSDNPNDRDVFAYTAAPTQTEVHVRLNSSVHTLQVASGSTWVTLTPNEETVALTLPSAGATIYLQVRPTVGTTVNPLINYQLIMSNPPAIEINYSVVGDVQPGWYPGTEINSALTFNGTVIDQFGNVVPFANNMIVEVTSEDGVFLETASVNSSGNYSHTVNIPGCFSGTTELRWDYQYSLCWEVESHSNGLHTYNFGVGGLSRAPVQYRHVCDARIRSDITSSLLCQ